MEEAIKTGIPTVFDYYIELYQNRGLWKDRLLSALVVTKTIKYDTLKQEYVVTEKSNANGTSSQVMGSLELVSRGKDTSLSSSSRGRPRPSLDP